MNASLWTPKPDGLVGKPVKRFEDDRLLRGQGQYIADLALDGMVHMAVVRSLYPHARILGIETAAALSSRTIPGSSRSVGYSKRKIPRKVVC